MTAARKALAYLQAGHDPALLIDAARRLVFLKGDDPHDYKFSSAVLEDYYHASPQWRERFLASSLLLCPARRTGTTTWSSERAQPCRHDRTNRGQEPFAGMARRVLRTKVPDLRSLPSTDACLLSKAASGSDPQARCSLDLGQKLGEVEPVRAGCAGGLEVGAGPVAGLGGQLGVLAAGTGSVAVVLVVGQEPGQVAQLGLGAGGDRYSGHRSRRRVWARRRARRRGARGCPPS